MFDVLQVLFWAITYLLIIVASILERKNKIVAIPYLAAALNVSWEINALCVSNGLWGHVVWVVLDVVIVTVGVAFLEKRYRVLYMVAIVVCCLIFWRVFAFQNGMLVSSFIIDLIMAICFLVRRKKLSSKYKIMIAVVKLFGDAFAGIYYAPYSVLIVLLACLVLFCNLLYLCGCIGEKIVRADKDGYAPSSM